MYFIFLIVAISSIWLLASAPLWRLRVFKAVASALLQFLFGGSALHGNRVERNPPHAASEAQKFFKIYMEANLVTDLGANCGGGPMASALSTSLDRRQGSGGSVPSGVYRQGPWWGQGAKHPEADSIFVKEQQNLASKRWYRRYRQLVFHAFTCVKNHVY